MNIVIKFLRALRLRKLAFKLELIEWERFRRTDEYIIDQAKADVYLESRCYRDDCWEDAGPTGLCTTHQEEDDLAWEQFKADEEAKMAQQRLDDEELDRYNDDFDAYDDEDDSVSTTEVYSRAFAHFGNAEMAREASEMYPGDFI